MKALLEKARLTAGRTARLATAHRLAFEEYRAQAGQEPHAGSASMISAVFLLRGLEEYTAALHDRLTTYLDDAVPAVPLELIGVTGQTKLEIIHTAACIAMDTMKDYLLHHRALCDDAPSAPPPDFSELADACVDLRKDVRAFILKAAETDARPDAYGQPGIMLVWL